MARPAAVAIGAVAAAWFLPASGTPLWTWLFLAAFVALGVTAVAADVPGGRAAIAAALAAIAIAARLTALPAADAAGTELPEGSGPWAGVVESVAAPRRGEQPATVTLNDAAHLRVAAILPRFPSIAPGDRVEITGTIRPPPDDDPYGDYLRRIGVAGTVRSRTLVVDDRPSDPFDLEALRRGAAAALARVIPEPEAGLAAGILVGLRDRVDRDLATSFTIVGASHVVAISGWNIAIVAASVAAVAGRLARRRRAALTIGAIAAYVAFVGPSPSVLRAAAMAGVVLVARESGRAGRAAAALGWAAATLLLLDPGLIRDAGFQLSTLATVGLLRWATPLADRLATVAAGRVPTWLTESLAISLAAQAATLPVVLASFGRLAIVSPVVNVFVVPLVPPAMAAGAVALVAGLAALLPVVPPILATLGGLPAWGCLAAIVTIVRLGAQVPFASVELASPADAVVAALVGVPLALLALRPTAVRATLAVLGRAFLGPRAPSRHARRSGPARRAAARPRSRLPQLAALALAGAILAGSLAVAHRPDGRTTIAVLDVGQGDAILVEGSRGSRLLVDGGPDPDRLLVALDERLPPWDRRIDIVILSHPHEDHVAGLALVLERYQVGRVFEPGMRGPGPGYAAWAERLAMGGVAAGRLAAGDHLMVDDLRLDVLWPLAGGVAEEPPDTGTGINNVSIVLLGEVAGRHLVLSGDVEEAIDPLLLAANLPRLDLLKVAHHGSRTASTDAFLEAVQPRVAVVSAGAGNPYGHPSPETIGRLGSYGARVVRTDLDGTVEVAIDAAGLTVRTTGPRRTASLPAVSGVRSWQPTPFSCGIPTPAFPPPAPPVARLPSTR